jgi:hypothetical protein
MAVQRTNDPKRGRMRLSEIEKIIRRERILIPPPARSTLIGLIEDGTFETAGSEPTKFGWLVYEDSFWRWVKSLDGE